MNFEPAPGMDLWSTISDASSAVGSWFAEPELPQWGDPHHGDVGPAVPLPDLYGDDSASSIFDQVRRASESVALPTGLMDDAAIDEANGAARARSGGGLGGGSISDFVRRATESVPLPTGLMDDAAIDEANGAARARSGGGLGGGSISDFVRRATDSVALPTGLIDETTIDEINQSARQAEPGEYDDLVCY